tara:strand:- start:148 stop:705 length:558 start_codon:yes stop_codon:yes gene_type:complete
MNSNVALSLILLALAVIGIVGGTYWMDTMKQSLPRSQAIEQREEPMPAFSVTTIDGVLVDTDEVKGKPVILNFWATWCPPCVYEFPSLVELAKNNPDIWVIALSSDLEESTIMGFKSKLESQMETPIPFNFLIARDPGQSITEDVFGIYRLPESLLIDRDGMIRHKIAGAIDWTAPAVRTRIAGL